MHTSTDVVSCPFFRYTPEGENLRESSSGSADFCREITNKWYRYVRLLATWWLSLKAREQIENISYVYTP